MYFLSELNYNKLGNTFFSHFFNLNLMVSNEQIQTLYLLTV